MVTFAGTADSVVRVSPVGLKFRDATTGAQVAEGLSVSAFVESRPWRRFDAARNGSGIFFFPTLGRAISGLDEAFAAGIAWDRLPPPVRCTVEVRDRLRRFTDVALAVDLPVRGLLRFACAPDGVVEDWGESVPLFSAPTRAIDAGMGVVRAELWDVVQRRPAAAAVLEVRFGAGQLLRAIADASGRAAVAFVYPSPPDPPAPAPTPPHVRRWNVSIAARSGAGVPGAEPHPLCAVLSQPHAIVWVDDAHTTPQTSAEVKFGEELVLRSQDAAGRPLSVLHLTPGATP